MPKTTRTIDKIFFVLYFFGDLTSSAETFHDLFSASYKGLLRFSLNKKRRNNFQQAVYRALRVGLVEKKKVKGEITLRLTSYGRSRLLTSFPNLNFRNRRQWDGFFRLVSFDVSEDFRKTRNFLRKMLSDFGFRRYHQSLYLSPFKIESEIKSYLKNTRLEKQVKLFLARVEGDPRDLVYDIWHLGKLRERYEEILREYRESNDLPALRERFLEVASLDPYVPRELLPRDWPADEIERLVLRA